MEPRTRSEPDNEPLVVIRPRTGRALLDVRELWAYRGLLYLLVWRDLKVRYRQTAFGVLWAIGQPILLAIVFTIFLSGYAGIAPAGVPYPIFAFAGLVPWALFSQSLIGASNSLVEASNLLQKVYFPRLVLPAAAVGSYVFDFLLAMAVLGVMMVIFGIAPTLTALAVVPMALLCVLTALAFGVWLAAVNVRYRDVRYAVPFLVQVWLFATPVAYSTAAVPQDWRFLVALNPMAGVIEWFRWALLGGSPPPAEGLITSVLVVVATLTLALMYFRRVERTFADVV